MDALNFSEVVDQRLVLLLHGFLLLSGDIDCYVLEFRQEDEDVLNQYVLGLVWVDQVPECILHALYGSMFAKQESEDQHLMCPVHAGKMFVAMSQYLVILPLILALVLYHDKFRVKITRNSRVVAF